MENGHVLPPITSSQTGVRDAASQICRGLSEGAEPKKPATKKAPDQDILIDHPVKTTLGELAKALGEDMEPPDDSGWDVGRFLKENVPQERKRGASLAAAVVKAKTNGQSSYL